VFFRIHFIPGSVAGDARVFGILENTTDQKVLEQQLRRSQKMEALGRLAGALAHDFNNLLSTIIGYSDLILTDDGFPPSLKADIDEIKKTADRAVALTKQLLDFDS
jgi:signal transduction histidine kinase